MSGVAKAVAALLIVAGLGTKACAQGPVSAAAGSPRSVKVIDYRQLSFPASLDLRGTERLPAALGAGGFVGKIGDLDLTATFTGLPPASTFGSEYLTYVLWAITPEGRPVNVAEILLEGTNGRAVAPSGKPKITIDLKSFGLVVTAEPYFAVTVPSDTVVMQQDPKPDASCRDVEVKYDLLPKGYYVEGANPQEVRAVARDPGVPFEIVEARHAVQIARWARADRYAPETFGVATLLLHEAEAEQARKKADSKLVRKTARESVETAEDARVLALKRRASKPRPQS